MLELWAMFPSFLSKGCRYGLGISKPGRTGFVHRLGFGIGIGSRGGASILPDTLAISLAMRDSCAS